jgi:putative restriction endonuclease
VRTFVAVTDKEWYPFLAGRQHLDEINFWQPGGNRVFRTLKPGEPLLFKLHYPDNAIVGGGFFTHASLIEAGVAWDAFGEKNGAPSYPEMRRRIERYRRAPADPRATRVRVSRRLKADFDNGEHYYQLEGSPSGFHEAPRCSHEAISYSGTQTRCSGAREE